MLENSEKENKTINIIMNEEVEKGKMDLGIEPAHPWRCQVSFITY